MSTISMALERVRFAAEAHASGDPAASGELLKEIHNLRMAAETPEEKTSRLRWELMQPICIRVAIEYGMLQAVADHKGADVSAAELASETGADELLIIRVMRLITYQKICEETGPGLYASNDTTTHITQKGITGGHIHMSDLAMPIGGKIVEIKRQHGLHQFPDGIGDMSPFEYTWGKPIFEYLPTDLEQKNAFDSYMSARRDPKAAQWFDKYPAGRELSHGLKKGDDAVLVVDVGGGNGHEISKFHQRFPQLPGERVLQDQPETIKGIDPRPDGITLMDHDFFNEQPVKGTSVSCFC